MSGLNRTLWRFTSFHDCLRVFAAVSATVVIAVVTSGAFSYLQTAPQSLIGTQIICMTGVLIGVRGWMRLKHIHRKRRNFAASNPIEQRETIIVVGVHDITALVLRRIAE